MTNPVRIKTIETYKEGNNPMTKLKGEKNDDDFLVDLLKENMKTNRKLKQKKRVKRKEAHLMGFKLIINNQGQFITELSKYPLDKVHLHFKKENAGVIKALLRECDAKFRYAY